MAIYTTDLELIISNFRMLLLFNTAGETDSFLRSYFTATIKKFSLNSFIGNNSR